jgi:hypothetical protein
MIFLVNVPSPQPTSRIRSLGWGSEVERRSAQLGNECADAGVIRSVPLAG